jgi:hypothetical protein
MSSPRWLRSIGRGAMLFALGGAASVLANAMFLAADPRTVDLLVGIPTLASVAVLTAATWLAGRREPAAAPRWLPTIVRAAAAYWPVSLLLPFVLGTLFRGRTIDFWRHRNLVETLFIAAMTWLVWRHFAGILRRGSSAALARWAGRLAWIWPPAMVLQALFLTDLSVLKSSGFLVMPRPVIGETMPLGLLPYSLYRWPRFDPQIAAWAALALLTLATLVLLILIARSLSAAAREIERP